MSKTCLSSGLLITLALASLPAASVAVPFRTPVVAAIIDGAVDCRHPDLAKCVWTNEAEEHGTVGIDDDGNGLVDDIHGWNLSGGNGELFDYHQLPADDREQKALGSELDAFDVLLQEMPDLTKVVELALCYGGSVEVMKRWTFLGELSHGTHCAGLLMKNTVSKFSVLRLIPGSDADPVPNRTPLPTQAEQEAEAGQLAAAFSYLHRNKVRVVSVSLGAQVSQMKQFLAEEFRDEKLADRCSREMMACGTAIWKSAIRRHPEMLFVMSAGDGGGDLQGDDTDLPEEFHLPSGLDLPNLVSVTACDRATGRIPGFSNYGRRSVHLAAPGISESSAVPGGGYARMSGTSAAAPNTANAAIRILEINPRLAPDQVKQILLAGTKSWGGPPLASGGCLDLEKCLELAVRSLTP